MPWIALEPSQRLLRKFIKRKDNRSLLWIDRTKDSRFKLTRWVLRLQELNFEVLHCPDKENHLPDALSQTASSDIDESCLILDSAPELTKEEDTAACLFQVTATLQRDPDDVVATPVPTNTVNGINPVVQEVQDAQQRDEERRRRDN
ncbi:hypothetical protein Trydic_g16152 [Trypoxylus dichotomus]